MVGNLGRRLRGGSDSQQREDYPWLHSVSIDGVAVVGCLTGHVAQDLPLRLLSIRTWKVPWNLLHHLVLCHWLWDCYSHPAPLCGSIRRPQFPHHQAEQKWRYLLHKALLPG